MKAKEVGKFILVTLMSILVTPILIIHMICEYIIDDYQYLVLLYSGNKDEDDDDE